MENKKLPAVIRNFPMTATHGKLNDFLRLSEREILIPAGTVSHEEALFPE